MAHEPETNAEYLGRYQRLVDSGILGVLIGDLAGNILEANDYFLALIGYTREEVASGRVRWTDITPPEHAAADAIAVQQIEAQGWCTPFEKEYVRKDGRRVPLILGGALLEGPGHRVITYALDISERKRAKDALSLLARASAELMNPTEPDERLAAATRLAVEGFADRAIIDLVDADGELCLAAVAQADPDDGTPSVYEIRGRFPLDPARHPIFEVMRTGHPFLGSLGKWLEEAATNAEHQAALRATRVESGMIVALCARGRTLGSLVLTRQTSHTPFDEADLQIAEELARRIATALDNARLLHEAKRARSWLAQLQAITADLSAASTIDQIAAIAVDESGVALGADSGSMMLPDQRGENLRVVYERGPLRDGHTSPPRSVPPRSVREALPFCEVFRTREPLFIPSRKLLMERYPTLADVPPNAQALAAVPLALHGEILGVLGFTFPEVRTFSPEDRAHLDAIARQVTQSMDRAQLFEAEARARAAADAANHAKSVFFANVSHELRTPLNAMLGFAQLLTNDDGIDAQARARAQAICEGGVRLLGLVDDMIELARIQAGDRPGVLAEVHLGALLGEIERTLRERAAAKRLSFEIHRATTLPARIITDEQKLRRLLVGLVTNAVNVTTRGGVLMRIRSRVEASGQLRFIAEVEHTGPELDPEGTGEVFAPFGQHSEEQLGAGLGLAIARELARTLGGEVRTARRPGGGSLFEVELPVEVSTDPELDVLEETPSTGLIVPAEAKWRQRLPEHLAEPMRDAAHVGDFDLLERCLDALPVAHAEQVADLRRALERYAYDDIERMLQPSESTGH